MSGVCGYIDPIYREMCGAETAPGHDRCSRHGGQDDIDDYRSTGRHVWIEHSDEFGFVRKECAICGVSETRYLATPGPALCRDLDEYYDRTAELQERSCYRGCGRPATSVWSDICEECFAKEGG